MSFKDLIEKNPPKKDALAAGDEPMPSVKPSIYVNMDEIPEMKDWELGQTYLFRARMKSRTVREKEKASESAGDACFEVESWSSDKGNATETSDSPPVQHPPA